MPGIPGLARSEAVVRRIQTESWQRWCVTDPSLCSAIIAPTAPTNKQISTSSSSQPDN